ncbi:hypothetical protein ACFZCL_30945 [Streptomyces sp. NPDC008159]|uniref:hypothetical protein n=1 Tax=Streptomyces sp. NPDC008159 TaxID=3364817 RepID=UPI0036EC3687
MKKNAVVRGLVSGFLIVAAAGAVLLAVPAGTVNASAAGAPACPLPIHCTPISD